MFLIFVTHVLVILILTWHFFLHAVLSKLITSLRESENKISGEQELEFLQSLLQSKELNALVNVHHKVAKLGKDDRIAPILSASMQVISLKISMNNNLWN